MIKLTSLILAGFIFTSPITAFETPIFNRVINDETVFYLDVNLKEPLFTLPYTYYVKVLSTSNGISKIEYQGEENGIKIDGYVNSSLLFSDNLEVDSPYPTLKITTCSNTVFYNDCNLTSPIQYIFKERELVYYGYKQVDDTHLIFCYYNGNVGFVKESDIYPFTLPLQQNELTFIKEEETFSPSKNDNLPIKLTVIGSLLFAGLIALFISLRKTPIKEENFYDE